MLRQIAHLLRKKQENESKYIGVWRPKDNYINSKCNGIVPYFDLFCSNGVKQTCTSWNTLDLYRNRVVDQNLETEVHVRHRRTTRVRHRGCNHTFQWNIEFYFTLISFRVPCHQWKYQLHSTRVCTEKINSSFFIVCLLTI